MSGANCNRSAIQVSDYHPNCNSRNCACLVFCPSFCLDFPEKHHHTHEDLIRSLLDYALRLDGVIKETCVQCLFFVGGLVARLDAGQHVFAILI